MPEPFLSTDPTDFAPARVALGAARAKLRNRERPEPVLALVGAAALLALSTLGFATAVIIGPPDSFAQTVNGRADPSALYSHAPHTRR